MAALADGKWKSSPPPGSRSGDLDSMRLAYIGECIERLVMQEYRQLISMEPQDLIWKIQLLVRDADTEWRGRQVNP